MADAQIAIIDGDQTQVVLAPGENPAIVTSIPGPQGPAGAGVPLGGTTNQVLFKQSSTNYDTAWGPITSAMIGDLEIVNADVSASAAIAGTKISPNFGSQNVTTTGTSTAASFIPTSSTAPTNGLYLSAANSVALSTNGTGRVFIDASGNVGVGNASPASLLTLRSTSTPTIAIENNSSAGAGVLLFRSGGTNYGLQNRINIKGVITNSATGASDLTVETSTGDIASPTERLRITSAGLVGIGSSSPGSRLTVNRVNFADASATGATTLSNAGITVEAATDTNNRLMFGIGSTGGAPWIQAQNTSSNATQSLILNPVGGAVGIGTTTVTGYSSNIVHLHGSTGAELHITTGGTGTAQSDGLTLYVRDSDGTAGLLMRENNALTFGTNDNERFRCDSSGRLLVGTSSARTTQHSIGVGGVYDVVAQVQQERINDCAGFSAVTNKNDPTGSILNLAKTRGTTAGSNTIVLADDVLGTIGFFGADGSDITSWGGAIQCFVDGTPGANDMPGRLVFSTTADGAASPTERLRITSTGQVRLAGAGITFNGDTATANELDDYEEGTWTPTATPSTSGTITLSSVTASYTKIGNTVSIRMFALLSAVSSPLGYIDISLPFTNSGSAAGSVMFYNGDTGAVMSNFIGRVSGNVFRITYGTGQVGTGSAPYARANSEIDIAAVYRN